MKSNVFEECFIESKTLVMDIIDIVTTKIFSLERGMGTGTGTGIGNVLTRERLDMRLHYT